MELLNIADIMTSHRFGTGLDLETGESEPFQHMNLRPRRFKFSGGKNQLEPTEPTSDKSKADTTETGGDFGIATKFKPRFAATDGKTSSQSLSDVTLGDVDGLPSTRLGRDSKFLGNYSHNFRKDDAKKDWWSPK